MLLHWRVSQRVILENRAIASMKILTINYTDILQIGGVHTCIRRVSEELAKRGHECYVLTVNPGNLKKYEIVNGIKIIRIRSPVSKYLYGLSPSMGLFLIRNLGKSIKPDIVHLNGYRSLLTPEAACILRVKQMPFVFSPHYNLLGYNTIAGRYLLELYKPFGALTFKWTEGIIANSEYSKSLIVKDFDMNEDRISVIHHGVERLEHHKSKTKEAKRAAISLLYVGVLIELKGVQHIIQALVELKRQGKQATLTIIGRGDYEQELRKLARTLEVEDHVIWQRPIYKEELHQQFMQADIVLLLSRSESYGIVVTEALAAGTPCIVAKTTALTEFLNEPGCFSIDYPPAPRELADLIVTIHESDTKVGPFSDRIRTWDKVAADYEKLYECVIEKAAN